MESAAANVTTWMGFLSLFLVTVGVTVVKFWIDRSNKKFDLKQAAREKQWESERKELENKITKLENRPKEEEQAITAAYSKIYGYLHSLLFNIEADRVFIIQPHPLIDRQYISVSLEVLNIKRDVNPRKHSFQFKRLKEWEGFVSRMSSSEWIIYRNVSEIKDPMVFAEATGRGVSSLFMKKLVDVNGNWNGNLCVEYIGRDPDNSFAEATDQIKGYMCERAKSIQYILPEYKPKDV